MNVLPIFDLEEFSPEVQDAFLDFCALEPEPLQDYVEWTLIMPAYVKKNISDDHYEWYRTVSDHLLEELENSDLDDEYEYVLIRTY